MMKITLITLAASILATGAARSGDNLVCADYDQERQACLEYYAISEEPPAPKSEMAVAASSDKSSAVDNITHLMLLKGTPSEQAVFLGSAVNSVGDKCTGEKAFYSGSGSDNAAYWSVRCTSGAEYVVQILPDAVGSASVLECGLLKSLGGSECFKSF